MYSGDVGTPTGLLELSKLIINNIFQDATPNLRVLTKKIYLGTPLDWFDYMRVKFNEIP